MLATGTATDPLNVVDSDAVTISAGTTGAVRTVRSSFLATRINWGNSITETNQGPMATPDPYYSPVGPITFGIPLQMVQNARTPGVRIYKHAAGHGTITCCLWDSAGTLLASKTVSWSADSGGWQTVLWDAPVALEVDATYSFGYHYPSADQNYAQSTYVWNNGQDTCVWPFLLKGVGSWVKAGASPTFYSSSSDLTASNFYIDPIAEWDSDVPGYVEGTDYFDQFVNGGSRFDFPLIIDFADPQWLDEYKALGMNTLISGAISDAYVAAIKAAGMDWYPTLHDNDMSAPKAVMADEDLAECVRGYMLTDEPEFLANTYSPAVLRTWRNNCRRLDSTRPIYLNVGRMIQENQGFNWHPVGISAKDVNLQWREYMSLVDIGSQDCYGIDYTYPFTYNASDSRRYGIWIYPLIVQRMLTEVTDERIPIWAEVETTSAFPNSPTPTQVERAVWASLIPGARGIAYFDHRFSSAAVSQDFAAMIHDAPMSAAVAALNAQILSLAAPLMAGEAGLIDGFTSTGTMARALGGYAAGAKIPMHYTSRVVGGTTYFFCQAIREGSTTATFSVPGFQGATLTVIGESRTLDVDDDGFFTDDFDDGDYTYHLYSTTATPSYTAPSNTVPPALTTDGTPQTGETITCSTGTWAGVPAPSSFTYQWLRDGLPIEVATSGAYLLQVADEGASISCTVTAINTAGSDSEDSNSVTAAAASPPSTAHFDEVSGHDVVAFWRLADLTDSVGAFDLTAAGSPTDVPGLTADDDTGGKLFTNGDTQTLSVADDAALRLTSAFSLEAWIRPDSATGTARVAVQKDGHYRISRGSNNKVHALIYTASGNYVDLSGTTTITPGTTYQAVVTWDGTTARLYVNGVEEANAATTMGPNSTASHVCIGKDLDSGNTGWDGVVCDVALYAEVLSAGDVSDLYDAGTG